MKKIADKGRLESAAKKRAAQNMQLSFRLYFIF